MCKIRKDQRESGNRGEMSFDILDNGALGLRANKILDQSPVSLSPSLSPIQSSDPDVSSIPRQGQRDMAFDQTYWSKDGASDVSAMGLYS
jgi:hypothetical protein